MSAREIHVPGNGRTLDAYLAEPKAAGGRHATIIIIHEIFGLDDHVRDVTRRFADQGYNALAPNLFTGPLQQVMTPANVQIAMRALAEAPPGLRSDPSKFQQFAASQPAERRPILEAFATVTDPTTQDGFALDLLAGRRYLRGLPSVDPARIGAVGFCFGGSVVARFATVDPELKAAVIFYGQRPPLERVASIRASVLGLYGSEDPGITGTVPEFAEAMKRAGQRFDYHVYPGARHAFFNDRRPNYHAESARDAWQRVRGFFGKEFA